MRYPSIDILRTIAIVVMVFVHFGQNLSGYAVPVAGLGAPLFAILSGVSYRLWLNGQIKRGISDEVISKISTRRGLFVFGVGFAFNIFVWLPEDAFNWDVLTFIGIALLLLNIARRLPLSISVLIAIVSLLVSPLLREMADYPAYWVNNYYEGDLTLSDVLIGFLATGYFPIFPWITYSLVGFVTGSLLFGDAGEGLAPVSDQEGEGEPPKRSPGWTMVAIGGAFLSVSLTLLLMRPYLPEVVSKKLLGGWTMFPPTIEYILGTIGWALFLFGLMHQFVDRNPRVLQFTGWMSIAKTFSRYSFTIYVLHHIVHLWPLWIYGITMGQEPTYYWTIAMSTAWSMPLALLFLVCCYFALRWTGPERRLGIESWMRWLCG